MAISAITIGWVDLSVNGLSVLNELGLEERNELSCGTFDESPGPDALDVDASLAVFARVVAAAPAAAAVEAGGGGPE